MQKRCDTCKHWAICKYTDVYSKVFEEIIVKVQEPFEVNLDCQHFSSNVDYRTVHSYLNDLNCTGVSTRAPEAHLEAYS